ncbi:hypothetical protein ACA910_020663 [Epithemia clementina (nom. ined.)]
MRKADSGKEEVTNGRKEYRNCQEGDRDGDEDDDEIEDDDDRKPPAREVVVQRQAADEDGEHSNMQQSYSADESVYSGTTSSMMTPNIRLPDSTMQLVGPSTNKLPLSTKQQQLQYQEQLSCHPDIVLPMSISEHEEQERAIRERIYTLSGSVAASLVAFLYIVLPFYALVALVMATVLAAMTAREMYQYALTEFDYRRQHRGFGEFLPDRLFELLTQQSLHDFLMSMHRNNGSTAGVLNRYLVLYFLPGLTQEQRNAFVQRLPRRHRQVLDRPGVGEFMGPAFMSLLLGQEGYHQRGRVAGSAASAQPQRHPLPNLLEEQSENSLRSQERRAMENAVPAAGLRDDDDGSSQSDLGLDIGANDLTGGLTNEQARTMARRLGVRESALTNQSIADSAAVDGTEDLLGGPTVEEDSEDGQISDAEATRIIVEAAIATVWAQFQRVTRPFINSASRWASRTGRDAVASLASYGGRLALLTGGVGWLGYMAIGYGGILNNSTTRGGMINSALTRSGMIGRAGLGEGGQRQTLWPMIVLGSGGVATVLLAANMAVRSNDNYSLNDKTARKTKEGSSDEKKKK